jgi:putative ribosome biogenesis GTPase RsgA
MTTDDNNTNIRIEQYKICVASVEKHSEQRPKINNFFLGINTSVVIAFNYLNQPDHNLLNKYLWMILSSGIIASLLWFINLYTYRNLAREKYNSIKTIEQDLPYKPFTESWYAVKNPKNPKCLRKLLGHVAYSKIEMFIPFFFIFLYLSMIFDFFNLHIYYGNP